MVNFAAFFTTILNCSTLPLIGAALGSQDVLGLTLDQVQKIADIVQKAFTVLAVVIGGIWAYFKFFRGRTFRPRLDLQVTGQLTRDRSGDMYLIATAALKNIGLTDIRIRHEGSGLVVSTSTKDSNTEDGLIISKEWEEEIAVDVFEQHQWVEPNEPIKEEQLFVISQEETETTGIDAIRLGLEIVLHRRFARDIRVVAMDTIVLHNEQGGEEEVSNIGQSTAGPRRPRQSSGNRETEEEDKGQEEA